MKTEPEKKAWFSLSRFQERFAVADALKARTLDIRGHLTDVSSTCAGLAIDIASLEARASLLFELPNVRKGIETQ